MLLICASLECYRKKAVITKLQSVVPTHSSTFCTSAHRVEKILETSHPANTPVLVFLLYDKLLHDALCLMSE